MDHQYIHRKLKYSQSINFLGNTCFNKTYSIRIKFDFFRKYAVIVNSICQSSII